MKDLFPGHYKKEDEEVAHIFKDCLFCFDSSALLDVYRVSPQTQLDILDLFEKIRERIWIPYHVAYEYHKNINTVLKEQVGSCQKAMGSIDKVSGTVDSLLSSKNTFPFINEAKVDEIKRLLSELREDAENQKEERRSQLVSQSTQKKISTLLQGRVGDRLSDEEVDEIKALGEGRYNSKIPPGYEDEDKKENRFGDLIVWLSVVRYARENKKNVIFVTNDQKEDWNVKVSGHNIGPRPELIHEFETETGCSCLIYNMYGFIHNSRPYVESSIAEDSEEELKSLGEADAVLSVKSDMASLTGSLGRGSHGSTGKGSTDFYDALSSAVSRLSVDGESLSETLNRLRQTLDAGIGRSVSDAVSQLDRNNKRLLELGEMAKINDHLAGVQSKAVSDAMAGFEQMLKVERDFAAMQDRIRFQHDSIAKAMRIGDISSKLALGDVALRTTALPSGKKSNTSDD